MRNINLGIVHCSDSHFGDAKLIDKWHKEKGWSGIGYHAVILNGKRKSKSQYKPEDDGLIEMGRPIEKVGSHCKGWNSKSIGVCLIGKDHFTPSQYRSLRYFVQLMKERHGLSIDKWEPHNKYSKHKTCPNFDVKKALGEKSLWEE